MSRRLAALNLFLRHSVKPRLARTSGPEEAAAQFETMARLALRAPPYLRDIARPGGLHWISAGPCRMDRMILYFHGGGYIAGSPATHRGMIGRLSLLSGLEICAPDYPLVQEARFPAAFEAAAVAWERCRTLGHAPNRILLAGDSAGGGLALALLAHLLQRGERPAGAVTFSPWTDLAMTGASLGRNRDADPFLPADRIGELVGIVCAGADPRDPRLSPLHAAFPDCPPVQIHVSETEILADDATRMAARLEAQGARVDLRTHPSAPHAWPVFDGWIPEARATLRSAARFAQASLGETSR